MSKPLTWWEQVNLVRFKQAIKEGKCTYEGFVSSGDKWMFHVSDATAPLLKPAVIPKKRKRTFEKGVWVVKELDKKGRVKRKIKTEVMK